jgi:hypothetical protein
MLLEGSAATNGAVARIAVAKMDGKLDYGK